MGESGRDYVQRKGWSVVATENRSGRGTQLVISPCPVCGVESTSTSRKFYLDSETGLWGCYKCGKEGNLWTLKQELGDFNATTGFSSGGRRAGTRAAQDALTSRFVDQHKTKRKRKTKAGYMPPSGLARQFHIELLKGAGAEDNDAGDCWRYLTKVRCFSPETLEHYLIGLAWRGRCRNESCLDGLDRDQRSKGRWVTYNADDKCSRCGSSPHKDARLIPMIAIPYLENDREVNFKYRSIPPDEKRFEREAGCRSILFGIDDAEDEFKRIVVCESETDAMALWQLDVRPVVSMTTGAKGVQDQFVEMLSRFDDIVIATDMDDAGEEGAEKLADALGAYRCRRMELPLHDGNECLEAGISPEVMSQCVESAVTLGESLVKHASDYAGQMRRTLNMDAMGVSTGFEDVDRLLGGLRPHELTVVTGSTACGKTTWATSVALHRAEDNDGVLIASFENTPPDILRKMVAMFTQQRYADLESTILEPALEYLFDKPVYFLDHWDELPLDKLVDAIEFGVRRYKLRLIIVDHLHFLIGNATDDNERQVIDYTVMTLKRVAMKFGVHVMLVVHPHKMREDKNGNPKAPDLNDLKGSSAISQNADNGIRVHRPRNRDRKETKGGDKAVVTVLKVRSEVGREGSIKYSFDGGTLQYTPWKEKKASRVRDSEEVEEEEDKTKTKRRPRRQQEELYDGRAAAAGKD